jgi:nucleoside recognition membrane protein YjiH
MLEVTEHSLRCLRTNLDAWTAEMTHAVGPTATLPTLAILRLTQHLPRFDPVLASRSIVTANHKESYDTSHN